MIPADETFGGTFPFKPNFFDGHGFKQHYVDEGKGEVIICLHGEPTWGYLYRKFIPELAKTHRVIVPDHMGFGKSETPQDKEYRLKTHVENLAALIDHLDLRDITFVGQDWGGPIMGAYTVRNLDRVKRLCLMNTVLGYGGAVQDAERGPENDSPWFKWVRKNIEQGTYEEVMGNLGSTILSVMKIIGFQKTRVVDNRWIAAYGWPFETKADCKGAIEFPLDVVEGRIGEYVMEGLPGVEGLRAKPAMLAEGMKDRAILPEVAKADFRALFPKGPIVEIPHAGHFCQEDAPEILVPLIQQFIQMT